MKFSFLFKSPQTTTTTSWPPWPSCATTSKTLSFRDDNNKNVQYHDELQTINGLRSERFFFEPGNSNSILEEAKTPLSPSKKSVTTLEIESSDPVLDFRVSMEEMVEAHGLRDWESLERLLAWYLRLNGKNNHRYIIGAFVDLLFSDEASCCSSSSLATTHYCSFTSPISFSSSSSSTYSSANCN